MVWKWKQGGGFGQNLSSDESWRFRTLVQKGSTTFINSSFYFCVKKEPSHIITFRVQTRVGSKLSSFVLVFLKLNTVKVIPFSKEQHIIYYYMNFRIINVRFHIYSIQPVLAYLQFKDCDNLVDIWYFSLFPNHPTCGAAFNYINYIQIIYYAVWAIF